MRTVKITEKGQIAIPKDIRKLEGFSEGKKVVVVAYKDHVELRPLKAIKKMDVEKMSTALLSQEVLAKDWLTKEENEAWKDL